MNDIGNIPGEVPLPEQDRPLAGRLANSLFVLSTGRCGTKTLAELLSRSNAIRAEHEPRPLMLAETKEAYQHAPLSKPEEGRLIGIYVHNRVESLLATATEGTLYAECSNRLTYFAPALASHLPRARFIHLYRNPADVVRSGMRRQYYTGRHPWDEHRIDPRPGDRFAGEWSKWGPFEKCCWYWDAVNDFSLRFMEQLAQERGLSVPAEALFYDGGQTALHIFDWLKVHPPAVSDLVRVLETPINAQQKGSFPKWEEWTFQQRSTLLTLSGKTASRLGYHGLFDAVGMNSQFEAARNCR